MKTRFLALVLCAVASVTAAPAGEPVDLDTIGKIRHEGFRNSKVMELAQELMDGVGPRLTGSPNMKAADDWAVAKFTELGLANAHLESWGPFGRGWVYEACSVRLLAPDTAQLVALPQAWSPGTSGPVRGQAIRVNPATKEDLEKFKGQLAGKIAVYGELRELKSRTSRSPSATTTRSSAKRRSTRSRGSLRPATGRISARSTPSAGSCAGRRTSSSPRRKSWQSSPRGSTTGRTLSVGGAGTWKKGDPQGVPNVVLAAEHFGRIARLLEKKRTVELEVDVKARFIEEDLMQWNAIAEIPGTDKKGEVVMIGAHFDSWHGGTGATDNGAGSVVAMEAMRILKALGVKPKRTIRIALWSGEEQGLLGSRAYVAAALRVPARAASLRVGDEMPSFLRPPTGRLTVKPEHAKLAAYFNLDNGTGKIRGIYAQENIAVVPIFQAWLEPLKDLGATAVTLNRHERDRPPVVRRRGPAGLPVHPGRDRVRHPHAPHEHGRLRAAAEGATSCRRRSSWPSSPTTPRCATRMLPRKPMPKDPTPTPTPAAAPGQPAAKPATPKELVRLKRRWAALLLGAGALVGASGSPARRSHRSR